MAGDRGLLDRLRMPEGEGRSARDQVEAVHDSILAHLQRLLNTRQGDSAALPEYGIPALTNLDYAGRAREIRRQIERSIRAFEPRLEGVRVKYIEPDPLEPLQVRFEISGRVATTDEPVGIRFDTSVDASGGWKVRG